MPQLFSALRVLGRHTVMKSALAGCCKSDSQGIDIVIESYYDAPTHEGSLPMRGDDQQTGYLFSYVSPDDRVPADHPLRPIRQMTDAVLTRLSRRFDRLYSDIGRPSIASEKLLRALLLQALYTVRSERLLMEQLQYNLLFRWFVGLSMDEPVWAPTVFSKNRDRLLEGDIAQAFFLEVRAEARAAGVLSDEHFTVDGTLLEAWASQKSFRPKDRPDPPSDAPTSRCAILWSRRTSQRQAQRSMTAGGTLSARSLG